LGYGEPSGTDAEGRELPVRIAIVTDAMAPAPGLRWIVDAADAAFPITIAARLTATKAGKPRGAPGRAGARAASGGGTGPAPRNDLRSGAETIRGSGPFPYETALVADVTDATTTGDPPPPSCQPDVSRSLWYAFTPSATASYTFDTCGGGSNGTTVDDTVVAVYT